ncbi:MAG: UvrB/UvrC motif-containing protein [Spirochaetes bacterium]|nr:UvrB/UvrC motif-containing protein [Spirochaetota bacterium]MBU1080742.1 UvrB/UvrC motif-containing protein [Spirochaetota bacterium]
MRCDVCGSSDSVFFIKPDGSGGELRMCRACAVAGGHAVIGEGLGARFDSMLSGVGAASPRSCPACGWTAERLRSTGRLGCSACAKAFRPEILSALRQAGVGGPYEGKVSRKAVHRGADGESPESLSLSLERAISAEDFEAAAEIRDRLRAAAERPGP